MFEIVPNWHPIFVHFTVALWSMAIGLAVAGRIITAAGYKDPLLMVAQWNLWLGTIISTGTVIAGWFAYNSVAHDTPSHAAMTSHRNWALLTFGVFLLITIWSVTRIRRRQHGGTGFLLSLIVAGFLLLGTAWKGGELVYRYGLGVMSLPQPEAHVHDHIHPSMENGEHGEEPATSDSSTVQIPSEPDAKHPSGNHNHVHADPVVAGAHESDDDESPYSLESQGSTNEEQTHTPNSHNHAH